jgi:glucose-1-phosphatase
MNKKIKLIIFDASGVTWNGGYVKTSKYLSKKYNIPFQRVFDILHNKWCLPACTGNMSSIEASQNAAEELGLPLSGQEIENKHLEIHEVNQGVLDFAQELKDAGYNNIILSNNFSKYIKKFRELFNLDKYFSEIINSQEIGLKKSQPEMFQYVLDKYNLTSSEVIYFDDLEENLTTPRKLNIKCFHYKDVEQIKKEVWDYLK